jgi:radical SAM-linked protein
VLKTVRLLFSKTGRAKYISHLDLNKAMIRAIRRAGIPIWYTEGFNRHPYITFAAPLSLGYEGMGEIMELRLTEEMPLAEVTDRLNGTMPEGLRIIETFEAVQKVALLQQAAYTMTLDCPVEEVTALLAGPEILVEKKTKKKTVKTIDIRPAFANALVIGKDSGCEMMVKLPCGSEGNINPALFITALQAKLGRAVSCQVVRTGLFTADGKEFR